MSEEITTLKEQEKMIVEPDQQSGIQKNDPGAWIMGIGLVSVGLILLIRPFGGIFIQNWWALFILVPGFVKLVNALNGRRTSDSIFGALFLIMLGSFFLLGLSFSWFWPFLLVLLGLKMVTSQFSH